MLNACLNISSLGSISVNRKNNNFIIQTSNVIPKMAGLLFKRNNEFDLEYNIKIGFNILSNSNRLIMWKKENNQRMQIRDGYNEIIFDKNNIIEFGIFITNTQSGRIFEIKDLNVDYIIEKTNIEESIIDEIKPKVSVIIVYNECNSIGQSLTSILSQEHKNIEVIIVYNHEKYKKELDKYLYDNRIKIYDNNGKNIDESLIKGLKYIDNKSEFIIFQNEYEISYVNRISEQMRIMEENEKYGSIIEFNGKPNYYTMMIKKEILSFFGKDYLSFSFESLITFLKMTNNIQIIENNEHKLYISNNNNLLKEIKKEAKNVLNREFDKIYVLFRKDKDNQTEIIRYLNKNNIDYESILVYNGNDEPYKSRYLKYRNDAITEKSYHLERIFKRKIIRNEEAWGYYETWKKILELSINKKHSSILCLDEYSLLTDLYHSKLESYIDKVKQNSEWKLMHFGVSQLNWRGIDEKEALEKNYYNPPLWTDGSFAVGISLEGMKKINKLMKEYICDIDIGGFRELYDKDNKNNYVAYPNLIIVDLKKIGIQNVKERKLRVKWT